MRYEVSKVLKQSDVMELVFGNSSKPGKILGRHFVDKGQVIAAYHPDAVSMEIIHENGKRYPMDSVERTQIFAAYIESLETFSYQISMSFSGGNTYLSEDPYIFPGQISAEEEERFLKGIWTDSYQKLGAHPMTIGGVNGVYFSVWAPSARRVSVIGDFNFWNGMRYPMNRIGESGIYEIFIPGVKAGNYYKYEIKTWDGKVFSKADPCGRHNQSRNGDASIVVSSEPFNWTDDAWMQSRKERFGGDKYVSIANCTMERMSEELMSRDFSNYTHLLFGGMTKKDKTRSWSEAGVYSLPYNEMTTLEVKQIVNQCHDMDLGVILQCDLGYFHKKEAGLSAFDGTSLYGFSDERKNFNQSRDMYRYSYSRPEVVGYLMSSIKYWVKEYHIDGFCFENQEELVYPVWDHEMPDENPAMFRRRSIDFFEKIYQMLKSFDEGLLAIGDQARDHINRDKSHLFGKTLYDYYIDHKTKQYLAQFWTNKKEHPVKLYTDLTLPIQKDGLEKAVLSLQFKDEDLWNAKSLRKYKMSYGFLCGMPGMKQRNVTVESPVEIRRYVDSLFGLVKEYKALQQVEYGIDAFEWVNGMNPASNVLSFLRKAKGEPDLLFVCHFGDTDKKAFRVGVPEAEGYSLLLDSNDAKYGPDDRISGTYFKTEQIHHDLRKQSICIDLRAYTTLVFKKEN